MAEPATLKGAPLGDFGAVVDFDLRQPLDAQQQAELLELFYRHQLLLFRGQHLSLEEQRRVASYIGPLGERVEGFDYVQPEDKILGTLPLPFHSDVSFIPHPIDAISLHAIDVVEGESFTDFVSARNAWVTLPHALREQIEGRAVVTMANFGPGAPEVAPFEVPEGSMHVERVMPWPHPVTGEPILYMSISGTGRVMGLPREESRALLDALLAHIYDARGVYRHVWRNGDFLVWDNFALQHGRPPIGHVTRRVLQRATVERVPQGPQTAGYRRIEAAEA